MGNVIMTKRNEFNSLLKFKKALCIFLFVLLVAQFSLVAYFNLAQLSRHMDYDSSWAFLKSSLMWKEKAIRSDNWVETTNAFLDNSTPFASLLYGLTGNIFLSYGIVNTFIVLCMLLCVSRLLQTAGIKIVPRLFAYNLILCPYLTNGLNILNDLCYFYNLLTGAAYYNLRTLILFISIREYLVVRKKGRIDLAGYLSLLLCILAGISTGIFAIIMIFLPYMMALIERVLIKNDWKILKKPEALYGYLAVLFVFLGKQIGSRVLHIDTIDATRTWTPISQLWRNLGAPFQGLMKLEQALPVDADNVTILSQEGLHSVFPLGIFCFALIGIVFAVCRAFKDHESGNGAVLLLVNIVACNMLVLGLFNVRYSAVIFEERYLIGTYMAIILLVAFFLDCLKDGYIVSNLLSLALAVCLAGNDYVSDKTFIQTTNDSWQMQEISQLVGEQDTELVYVWGSSMSPMARCLRVYDMDHVYRIINDEGSFEYWGDYKYFDDNAEHSGKTVLIVSNNSDAVPETILSQFTLIQQLNSVSVYVCDYNPIDRVAGITGEVSIDYPSTPGMIVGDGEFEGNSFIAEGNGGFTMRGPLSLTVEGEYDFILDYEILEGSQAVFDISIEYGATILGGIDLDPALTSAAIQNVPVPAGFAGLEYRIRCGEGTRIKIDRVTIQRKDGVSG